MLAAKANNPDYLMSDTLGVIRRNDKNKGSPREYRGPVQLEILRAEDGFKMI